MSTYFSSEGFYKITLHKNSLSFYKILSCNYILQDNDGLRFNKKYNLIKAISSNYIISWYAKKLDFATKLNFLLILSLQHNGVNHWYFKLSLFDLHEFVD